MKRTYSTARPFQLKRTKTSLGAVLAGTSHRSPRRIPGMEEDTDSDATTCDSDWYYELFRYYCALAYMFYIQLIILIALHGIVYLFYIHA